MQQSLKLKTRKIKVIWDPKVITHFYIQGPVGRMLLFHRHFIIHWTYLCLPFKTRLSGIHHLSTQITYNIVLQCSNSNLSIFAKISTVPFPTSSELCERVFLLLKYSSIISVWWLFRSSYRINHIHFSIVLSHFHKRSCRSFFETWLIL